MEQFLNKFLELVTSEYGVFTGFLLICVIVLASFCRLLWRRNEFLGNKFIEVIPEMTKVMTQVVEKITHLDDED